MNKEGAITRPTREWGSKAIKEEARLRGTNNRARREAIREQVRDEGQTPVSDHRRGNSSPLMWERD